MLQVMPDDHSELVPPLPIPNRTVKRLCADDSAATSVKVGHRQAFIRKPLQRKLEGFLLCAINSRDYFAEALTEQCDIRTQINCKMRI